MSLARAARAVLACWFGLLASIAASVAVVVGAAAPAAACSCAVIGAAEHVEMADTVFTGVLQEQRDDGRRVTYEFVVDSVLEGDPGERAVVRSGASGASCGLGRLAEGERYVVFATDGRASLCGGTSRAGPSYVADVEAVTGPGRPPAGAETGGGNADAGASAEQDGTLATAAVVGAAAAVVLGVVLVLTRRRRTR
ncbi:hypothetical protein [Nocardioides sp. SYSU DS0663]|uniref:hypothetical protein n=1 Tax=Nocardioides sp. SYSU DS0663 TaxID=3416445 RepID=UPI003F4BB004